MRSGTLAIIVACVAVTLILIAWIIRAGADHIQVIANTVSLGGAALTFVGLAYAYAP